VFLRPDSEYSAGVEGTVPSVPVQVTAPVQVIPTKAFANAVHGRIEPDLCFALLVRKQVQRAVALHVKPAHTDPQQPNL